MWTKTICSIVLPGILLCLAWSPGPRTAGSTSTPVAPGSHAEREYRVFKWVVGDQRLKLIRARDGFCFLSAIGGSFAGGGEWVRVYVDDGWWYLDGHCQQPLVWAEATCVELDRFAADLPVRAADQPSSNRRR